MSENQHASSASDASAGAPSPEPTTSTMPKPDGSKKRASSGEESTAAQKITKRRAARACVSCRARKVRCDVVEGAPCGNCRWDNVECIVQESRRRKKNVMATTTHAAGQGSSAEAQQLRARTASTSTAATKPVNISSADLRRPSHSSVMSTSSGVEAGTGMLAGAKADAQGQFPTMPYQAPGYRNETSQQAAATIQVAKARAPSSWTGLLSQVGMLEESLAVNNRTAQFVNSLDEAPDTRIQLPPFVRPLPPKVASEDVAYLHAKGALTLPEAQLQNALLQAYVEYVHPYMPLMDLHEFLGIINCRDGVNGQISLFLYQAVMFAATAFVDRKFLRDAGYATRKAARKSYFQKTRLLYDFDYEQDRVVLVQGLLLMTYWYETPDDQKDTWHWMGVAISLAHTIGLHRNPETTSIPPTKQKLWKRIWWSCFMRDRLIALGMRRPTRIKDEDFDVPMLTESDFEIQVLPENNTIINSECTLMRDLAMQSELAIMCIYKAKLCVCISRMLKAQYSVLIRDKMKPDNTTNSTMMLFPNKGLDNVESVGAVDLELMAWAESLPTCCQYRSLTPLDLADNKATVAVQRTLLHMVYYTTVSALHRPQFLPSSPLHAPTASRQVQDTSRLKVRDAAMHITRMATELHHLRLERFLPTTGVTVILPAMIIHLLDLKNPSQDARDRAMHGFRQCMRVMLKLREIYAAADYATGFLDAAMRKAAIDMDISTPPEFGATQLPQGMAKQPQGMFAAHTPPPESTPFLSPNELSMGQKARQASQMMLPPNTINAAALELSTTSPPQTEFDTVPDAITPSASGGSEGAQVDMDPMDLDFMETHDEFDWNAVTGADLDMDQWLQFPSDNAANKGDDAAAGIAGADDRLHMLQDGGNAVFSKDALEMPTSLWLEQPV
ncbi:cutinase transcription factor 1 beta [Paramyrothecium foliicola]|nr:cutinase transcription factor 1 beta [Paramyrothecium foliicola]